MDKEEDGGVTDKMGKAAGLELLQAEDGEQVLTDRILGDDDLKRIKLLKLKQSAVSVYESYRNIERNGRGEGTKRCA